MEKRNFAKLIKLTDITYDGETAEEAARWKNNVITSGVADSYGIDDDGINYKIKQFSTDEIEFAHVNCYVFIGSLDEEERFYEKLDWITVREKATGDYYVYENEEIYEGAL